MGMTKCSWDLLIRLIRDLQPFPRYFHDEWARYACAIGFSDVLFALKILLVCYPATHEKWREGYLLRYLPCPSLSLVTLEFALLHLFVPEASLQSHLAGVIVGMLYVAGPLSWPMNALWNKLTLGWGTCCGKLNHPLVYMLGMTVDDQGYIVKPGMENNPYYGQTKSTSFRVDDKIDIRICRSG
jgi:hypothetical protein